MMLSFAAVAIGSVAILCTSTFPAQLFPPPPPRPAILSAVGDPSRRSATGGHRLAMDIIRAGAALVATLKRREFLRGVLLAWRKTISNRPLAMRIFRQYWESQLSKVATKTWERNCKLTFFLEWYFEFKASQAVARFAFAQWFHQFPRRPLATASEE